MSTSQGVRDDDLLFTSAACTPVSRNNFRTKYWKLAVDKANVRHNVTFNNLRGAHASWLLAGGADIVVVQEGSVSGRPQRTAIRRHAAGRTIKPMCGLCCTEPGAE